LWIDNDDNVYVGLFGANFSGDGATVLQITPDGTQNVYATGQGLNDVIGVVGDDNGEIYAGNFSEGEVYRITGGNVSLFSDLRDTLSNARLNMIGYADGFIYVPSPSGRILRVDDTSGEAVIFAGSADESTTNGSISEATFSSPAAIDFSDDNQEMFVLDTDTGNIRRVYIGD
jgi:sugar lactone lactonase YvrE